MYQLRLILTNPHNDEFFETTALYDPQARTEENWTRIHKFQDQLSGGVPDLEFRNYHDDRGWHQETVFKNFITAEGAANFFKDAYFSSSQQRALSLEYNKAKDMRSVITVEQNGRVLKNLLDCEGNICFKYDDGHCDPNSDCPASIERAQFKNRVIPITSI